MIAFGTVKDFVDEQPDAEAAPWKHVRPIIDGLRRCIDELRAIVSAGRPTDLGMAAFDATGRHGDSRPYDRPGGATIARSRRRVGNGRIADGTHRSLFSGTPARPHGPKRGE